MYFYPIKKIDHIINCKMTILKTSLNLRHRYINNGFLQEAILNKPNIF